MKILAIKHLFTFYLEPKLMLALFLCLGFVLAFRTSTTADGLTGYYKVEGGSLHLVCTGTPSAAELAGIYYPDDGHNFQGGYSVTGRSTTCNADSQGSLSGAANNAQSGNSEAAIACVFQAVNADPVLLNSDCLLVNRTGYWPFIRTFFKVSEPDTNSIIKGNTSTIS
jgi:hypothetical protein